MCGFLGVSGGIMAVDPIGKSIKTEVSGDGHYLGQNEGLQGAVGVALFNLV